MRENMFLRTNKPREIIIFRRIEWECACEWGGGGVAALSKGLGGKQLCDNIKQLGREELWSYIEKKNQKCI